MTVGIIGAGIAGLTLGCLLKRRGIECEIFEQSDDVTKYGAGISLTSNAQFPLNNLNVLEEIKDAGCEPLDIVWSCLLYTSPSPRDPTKSRMPSSA